MYCQSISFRSSKLMKFLTSFVKQQYKPYYVLLSSVGFLNPIAFPELQHMLNTVFLDGLLTLLITSPFLKAFLAINAATNKNVSVSKSSLCIIRLSCCFKTCTLFDTKNQKF